MLHKVSKYTLLISLSLPYVVHSQVISEFMFLNNGGDLNNISGTIATANEPLRKKSYDPAFNAVGQLSGCTATWLGDDDKWVYILSAAHCTKATSEVMATNAAFYNDDKKTIIGSGMSSTVHTVPQRIKVPLGYGGASTDLEILKLAKLADYLDAHGKKVIKPVLYDGNEELNKPVEFVGYGSWGVNITSNGGYFPTSGVRRLTSMSVIDSIFESDHGIGAGYEPVKESPKWGRVASGDSGSAWWQEHQGIKTIIAVTNGNGNTSSTGSRISQYIDWIKSVYPDVDILSEHAFDWHDNDRKGTIGNLYQYNNPYNNQTEYFMLKALGSDQRYWYFPTDKTNNTYWVYLGTDKARSLAEIKSLKSYKTWDSKNHQGVKGDTYIYFNPYNNDIELFTLNTTGFYWHFPADKRNNTYWTFVKAINY